MAPKMGVGWLKQGRVNVLVRASGGSSEAGDAELRVRLVRAVAAVCDSHGGRITARKAFGALPSELAAFAQSRLGLKTLAALPEACGAECEAAQLRTRGKLLLCGEADDPFDAAIRVEFDRDAVREARRALDAALASSSQRRVRTKPLHGKWSLLDSPPPPADAAKAMLVRQRASAGFERLLPARRRLPAFSCAAQLQAAVATSQVTLVLGATGCGKSTQLPQLLMEAAIEAGLPCRIIATQPRRISAAAVAQRVAAERGESLGQSVGYKVRFEESLSPQTHLVFCTVGVLLAAMQGSSDLNGVTHIVVDEVHERDVHTDFLLALLRPLLARRPELRVVLMSATVDPAALVAYFPHASTVSIPGKTNYPIDEQFLEDVLPLLPASARAPPPQRPSSFAPPRLRGLERFTSVEEVARRLPDCSADVARVLASSHAAAEDAIDLELIASVVLMVHRSQPEGAVLVFVPGWFEIAGVVRKLQESPSSAELQLFPLHSRMPTAEQRAIFDPPPTGMRKVIVSTVIAETSITVEDVVYVVDSGKARTTALNHNTLISALCTQWYPKASGMQRRGRAGRCRPGVWYRLFSSIVWEAMAEHEEPEMLRSPLETLCLDVAALGLGSPAAFLATAVSPPQPHIVAHALSTLHALGAVTDAQGSVLTPLGEQLSSLRIHPALAKMLLLAKLFGCTAPMLTICAALGYKSPFLCPLGKEQQANAAKEALADGSCSDHIALINAYEGWTRGKGAFANRYFLSHQTLQHVHKLRDDLCEAVGSVARERDCSDLARDVHADTFGRTMQTEQLELCRVMLVAGLYPNLAWLRRRGKGSTLGGLKVTAHPGSVNARAADACVVFYDIQETSDRFLYDTSVVGMAPVLLFSPGLRLVHRGSRAVFAVQDWTFAVAVDVADDLLAMHQGLRTLLDETVGRSPKPEQARAIEILAKLLTGKDSVEDLVGVDSGDEDDAFFKGLSQAELDTLDGPQGR